MRRFLFVILTVLIPVFLYSQTWGDYTLYSVQNNTNAYLIDMSNNTYKSWSFGLSKKTGYSTYLTKGDTLVRSYSSGGGGGMGGGGGSTGGLQKVLWDGTVYWDITYANMHHDICPMPNGNVLIIVYDSKTSTQAVAMGANSNRSIKSEKIVELKRTGLNTYQEVWAWYLWDHLCQSYSSSKPNYYANVSSCPELLNINVNTQQEIMHLNGLDYNEELDQIVFSCHNLNELFVIDHSTTTAEAAGHTGGNAGKGGDFLYRWGKPANYGFSGTTNFNVIHDARWLPNDHETCPGCISAYNNKGGTGNKSSSDLIQPPRVGYNYTREEGQAFGPSTYTHRYTAANSSQNMGGQQRLPNGNVFMCVPANSTYLTEVNSNGTSVWSKTVSGTVPKAYRYDKCYVRGPIASASASETQIYAGATISLNASATSVTETNPDYSYAWSSNSGFSSSEQNPSLSPNSSDVYTVTVTNNTISCTASASVTVSVVNSTLGLNVSSSNQEICAGDEVQLNSTPTGGTNYSFEWTSIPEGFYSNQQNPIASPEVSTTYYVSVTSGSNSIEGSVSVIVNQLPEQPTISFDGEYLVSSQAQEYQWYLENNQIQGATNQNYKPLQNGNYYVEIQDINACSNISELYYFNNVNIISESIDNSFLVYPNPASNVLNISNNSKFDNFEVKIIDVAGNELFVGYDITEISLEHFCNGLYYICIFPENSNAIIKKLSVIN